MKTGLVMWEWHALGHIPISRNRTTPCPKSAYPWDYVHLNSIRPGPSGDVLLSSRNTWTLYDVDVRSGAIRWRLGGATAASSWAPARASTGSTTPSGSPAG